MIKNIAFSAFIASLFLLVACAAGSAYDVDSSGVAFPESAAEEPARFESDAANIAGDVLQTSFLSQPTQERLIIREGDMDVVVEDSSASLVEIGKMAEGRGGWVVSSQLYDGGGAKSGSITIRIPVDQFEATMAAIRGSVVEVKSESTSSQDVTEEYVDLEARIDNLEATADRVRSFLDDSDSVEEALSVNQELSRLEGEIESLKARAKYLSQSAGFSLLVIYVTPDELSLPIEIIGWRPDGVARDAFESLLSALEGVGTVAIWSGVFCLPLLLIFGVPAFFIGRYFYRRRLSGKQSRPETEQTAEATSDPEVESDEREEQTMEMADGQDET